MAKRTVKTAEDRMRQHRVRYVNEYVGLRMAAFLFSVLPYRIGLLVAWTLAFLAFHVFRFRVRRAKERIREVFGDTLTGREVNRIAWTSMRNFAFNMVEFLRFPKLNRAWVEAHVDHEQTLGRLKEQADAGQGCVLATPHMGNWELGGVGPRLFGLPFFFVQGKQHNPLVDGYLKRIRAWQGIDSLAKGDGALLKKVVRRLKAGEIFGLANDLRSKTEGVSVNFLGKPANLTPGMALFARQARVPVFPAVSTRIGWTRHKWQLFEPVMPDREVDREADITRITQEVMDVFDRAIREQPEQYFWFNNRWVLYPFPPPPKKSDRAAERVSA